MMKTTNTSPSRVVALLPIALLLLLTACDSADTQQDVVELRPLSSTEASVVSSGRSFGFRLFSAASNTAPDSNVVQSPLSVSMALGMALNGAREETFAQMLEVLAPDAQGEEDLNGTYRYLVSSLPRADNDVTVSVANSAWYRAGFSIEQEFNDVVEEVFAAETASIDFADDAATETINGWVEEHTNGLIPSIIESIPAEAVAYLINAVYFKGNWRDEFDPDDTAESDFTNVDGSVSPVPLMHRSGTILYFHGPDFSAVDLAYGDSLFSMTVILPEDPGGINELAGSLDDLAFLNLVEGLQPTRLDLSLPRFEVEHKVNLKDALIQLGMTDAFDESAADFGRMNANEQLFINGVLHRTFVSVNERGTEAAAATAVEVGVTSLPPQFIVNRPFVFVIRERVTGTLLFIGKVVRL